MKTNLRAQFALLSSLPNYLPGANTLSRERAQEIAQSFGDDLAFLAKDFAYANECAANPMTRADLRGNGLGMFHNAERLFLGYVYDMHYCAACEDAEVSRRD